MITQRELKEVLDYNAQSGKFIWKKKISRKVVPGTLEAMRDAMRKVMSEAYIKGSNDCHKAMKGGEE